MSQAETRGCRRGRNLLRVRPRARWFWISRSCSHSGDAACDITTVRAEPDVYGPVTSDPTVIARCDRHGKAGRARAGLGVGWRACPERWRVSCGAVGDRSGRHADHCVLGEGTRGPDVQARVRVHPLLAFIDHEQAGTGDVHGDPLAGQRGVEHRGRSHHLGEDRTRSVTPPFHARALQAHPRTLLEKRARRRRPASRGSERTRRR